MNFPRRAKGKGIHKRLCSRGSALPALQTCSGAGERRGPGSPQERQAGAGRPRRSARSPLPLLPQRRWSFKTWSFHRNFARPSSQPSRVPAEAFAAAFPQRALTRRPPIAAQSSAAGVHSSRRRRAPGAAPQPLPRVLQSRLRLRPRAEPIRPASVLVRGGSRRGD